MSTASGKKQEWLQPRCPPVEAYPLLSRDLRRRVDAYPEPERAAAAWLLLIKTGPEWRARTTPCRNCAAQRWLCVDPSTPGQRRRCEGCFRSGWACNEPSLGGAPATPHASASAAQPAPAPSTTASSTTPSTTASATPSSTPLTTPSTVSSTAAIVRSSTVTSILDLTAASDYDSRRPKKRLRNTEETEGTVDVDVDVEAETFFATSGAAGAAEDSDDDIEFVGMSEPLQKRQGGSSALSVQPATKRPRKSPPGSERTTSERPSPSALPSQPQVSLVTAPPQASANVQRALSAPKLLINESTAFTPDVVRRILAGAQRTSVGSSVLAFNSEMMAAASIASEVIMVSHVDSSWCVSVSGTQGRTVSYIHVPGFSNADKDKKHIDKHLQEKNLIGKGLHKWASRACPHLKAVPGGLWTCIVAIWLTRGLQRRQLFEQVSQVGIKQDHVADDLNAILQGEQWSGQCLHIVPSRKQKKKRRELLQAVKLENGQRRRSWLSQD